jgi:hypothetical protein
MRILILCVTLLLDALLLCSSSISAQGIAATFLILLPGFVFSLDLFAQAESLATRVSLSLGASFSTAIFLLYLIQALPGPTSSLDVLILLNLLCISAAWRASSKVPTMRAPSVRDLLLLALLVMGGALRLINLGDAEFQGDEARAVILATGVTAGDDQILLLHKKGPGEALLAAPSLILTRTTNEFAARFPFCLAGVASILAIFAAASALSAGRSALPAYLSAGLLALDGFLVPFSRIVQYQSVLVFLSICALLCVLEIRAGKVSRPLLLKACSGFCAAALFCHYDAAITFPALFFGIVFLLRTFGVRGRQWISELAVPGFQFAVLSSAFYAPFFLSDYFATTVCYLSQRAGTSKIPTNNLPRYVELLSFYGGGLGALVFLSVVVGAVYWIWEYSARKELTVLGAVSLVSLIAGIGQSWSFVLLAIPALILLCAKGTPFEIRLPLVWTVVGLSLLGFFFARPNTHFYVIHAAIILLAAMALAELLSFLQRAYRGLAICLWLIIAAIAAYSTNYIRLAFLDPTVEYRYGYNKVSPAPFLDPPFSTLPSGAFFGFQHQSGWKAVGSLIAQGKLVGTYDSNEEELITSWYTRGAQRKTQDPDLYFVASRPNDVVKISENKLRDEYSLWGRVYTASKGTLSIYFRGKSNSGAQPFALKDFIFSFDALPKTELDARTILLTTAVSR